jgi:hypothetical protein
MMYHVISDRKPNGLYFLLYKDKMNTDSLLLKLAGDTALETSEDTLIPTDELLNRFTAAGKSPYDFYESLAILGGRHYVKLEPTMAGLPSEPELRELIGGGLSDFSLTTFGFEQYAQAHIPNYLSIVRDVQTHIVNDDQCDSASIAAAVHQKQAVVDHIYKNLEQQGLIRTMQSIGSTTITITRISPELRRLVRLGM